ncbi:MAG: hypothetical protein WB502_10035 [Thermoactinomyces sp.]
MFYSVKELKSPHVLSKFRFHPFKQLIAAEWESRRKTRERGYIELENVEQILVCYEEIKALLFIGFAQDFPNDERSPSMMNTYIRQCCIAFGFMKDIPTRNIWLDLIECFQLLWELDLLKVDENGDLI